MSFLNNLGGAGAAAGANGAATGLGNLIGAQPSRVSMIADRIGKASNGIAAAGGADAGYDGSAAPVDNHLQLLDPETLRGIIARFAPQGYAR